MLDRLADCMAFGALEPCPECKDGQLSYGYSIFGVSSLILYLYKFLIFFFLLRTDGYHCRGNLTEWTKCIYVIKTPKRKPFVVPEELKEDHPFL